MGLEGEDGLFYPTTCETELDGVEDGAQGLTWNEGEEVEFGQLDKDFPHCNWSDTIVTLSSWDQYGGEEEVPQGAIRKPPANVF